MQNCVIFKVQNLPFLNINEFSKLFLMKNTLCQSEEVTFLKKINVYHNVHGIHFQLTG